MYIFGTDTTEITCKDLGEDETILLQAVAAARVPHLTKRTKLIIKMRLVVFAWVFRGSTSQTIWTPMTILPAPGIPLEVPLSTGNWV